MKIKVIFIALFLTLFVNSCAPDDGSINGVLGGPYRIDIVDNVKISDEQISFVRYVVDYNLMVPRKDKVKGPLFGAPSNRHDVLNYETIFYLYDAKEDKFTLKIIITDIGKEVPDLYHLNWGKADDIYICEYSLGSQKLVVSANRDCLLQNIKKVQKTYALSQNIRSPELREIELYRHMEFRRLFNNTYKPLKIKPGDSIKQHVSDDSQLLAKFKSNEEFLLTGQK